MKDLEQLKQKYPLAVDTLKHLADNQTGFYFDPHSGFVMTENGVTMEVCEVRGWGIIQYKDQPESRQDQIGEMLAELLNLIAKP